MCRRKGVKPIGGAGSFAGSPSSRVVSPTSSLPAHVSPSNSRRPSTPCSQALPSPASSPKRSSRELVPLVDCRGHRESPKHVSRELARLVEHPGVVGPRESARRCSRDLVSLVEPRGGPRESARRCSRASRTSCDISSLHRSTPYEPLDMREALTQLKHTINNGKVAVHTVHPPLLRVVERLEVNTCHFYTARARSLSSSNDARSSRLRHGVSSFLCVTTPFLPPPKTTTTRCEACRRCGRVQNGLWRAWRRTCRVRRSSLRRRSTSRGSW